MNEATNICKGCGARLDPGFLECPACHRLVHGAELARLASAAKQAETSGDFTQALSAWRKAVTLLPAGTSQRRTIDGEMRRLSAIVDGRAPTPPGAGGKKAGVVAGGGAVGAALLKAKALLALLAANGKLLVLGLLKLPTLLSMIVYANVAGGRGFGLSLGIIGAIYVHEVGHVAALRRYGIDASAPMFIPGFGAVVRMRQYPTDAHEEARTGLAGPLWGLFASVLAVAIGIAASLPTALLVGSWSATINSFNLIPVWQLDGARGLKALSKSQRWWAASLAVATGLVAHQIMAIVVGLVIGGRAAFEPGHEEGDRGVFGLFASLVVLHPALACLADHLGSGM